MEKKRPRDEDESSNSGSTKKCPEWWSNAVQWIMSGDAGGMVHPGVTFDKDTRELVLTQKADQNELLLQIPKTHLVSVVEAMKSSSLSSDIATDIAAAVTRAKTTTTARLFNNEQDIILALILASCQSEENSFYEPYLKTLPGSASYNLIPRRWDTLQLERLLTGSNLMNRVQKSKEGTMNDHDVICKAWNDVIGKDESKRKQFPSFDSFSDMLAAVTSRAFAGMGGSKEDDDIAMIPLLDLANHHRGSGGEKKNVSYTKDDTDGSVQVRATRALDGGTTLRITYGAQGNGQLLLNYGFTIPNNIEPDGSSNDVLEFLVTSPSSESNIVELRAGPKSYTFGPLVKAIELFYPKQGKMTSVDGASRAMNDKDDMEAFLDECDEEGEDGGPEAFLDECEEEEEDEDFDWNKPMDENDDDDDDDDDFGMSGPTCTESSVKNEIKALDALEEALLNAEKKYSLNGKELDEALSNSEPSPLHYSAILVSSELRTIRLYLEAIGIIRDKLQRSSASQTPPSNGTTVDEKLVSQQAGELAKAFLTIRYPSFL